MRFDVQTLLGFRQFLLAAGSEKTIAEDEDLEPTADDFLIKAVRRGSLRD
jgi:hypothetical protein